MNKNYINSINFRRKMFLGKAPERLLDFLHCNPDFVCLCLNYAGIFGSGLVQMNGAKFLDVSDEE